MEAGDNKTSIARRYVDGDTHTIYNQLLISHNEAKNVPHSPVLWVLSWETLLE